MTTTIKLPPLPYFSSDVTANITKSDYPTWALNEVINYAKTYGETCAKYTLSIVHKDMTDYAENYGKECIKHTLEVVIRECITIRDYYLGHKNINTYEEGASEMAESLAERFRELLNEVNLSGSE